MIPVHLTVQCKLKAYETLKNTIIPSPEATSFFISEAGKRLSKWIVERTFVKLSRQIGLRGQMDRHGPRLHDFRHTFAVKTLLRWYQSGDHVEQRIPYLSAYLGHRHLSDTYWYLSAVPELMQLVVDRLHSIQGGLM